jgi:hypothetical protein
MVGVGLSAACGFRVFVPLLVLSIGTHAGHVHPPESLQWLGTTPALIAFGIATVFEVVGFLVPWLDHMLDTLAVPAAIVAGTVLTSGMMSGMTPFFRWTVGLIAGGGAAGMTGIAMATLRGGSTATTGGIANPLFAAAESAMSLLAAVMAIVMPLVAIFLIALFLVTACLVLRQCFKSYRARPARVRPQA